VAEFATDPISAILTLVGAFNMDNTVIVALISAGGSVLVAITALVLNYRGFASIDARLNLMQSDMKDLYKAMTAIEVDVARLKDKVGL
jgi:hypothetical protein